MVAVNPISGRLLANQYPIVAGGGGFRPLEIAGSSSPIFKTQTAFGWSQRDLPFNKKKFQKSQ